jgi:hypothetical protein
MQAPQVLAALQLLIALNAIGGGVYGLSGAAAVPREWLAGSPFTSYLIPSAVLVVVVGGSHLMASVRVWQRHREARRLSQLAGTILIGWITAQLAIIGFVSWLQPAMLVAALLELALAVRATAATRGTSG